MLNYRRNVRTFHQIPPVCLLKMQIFRWGIYLPKPKTTVASTWIWRRDALQKKSMLAVNDTLWYTYKKLLKMAIYNRFTLQTVWPWHVQGPHTSMCWTILSLYFPGQIRNQSRIHWFNPVFVWLNLYIYIIVYNYIYIHIIIFIL